MRTALHPLALALADAIEQDRGALSTARLDSARAGLRALAEQPGLVAALESILVLAHRVERLGGAAVSARLVALAAESVEALTHQRAREVLDRLSRAGAALARLSGAGPRVLEPRAAPEGAASWRLSPVLALPRRA